jgi:hypothetical protein
MRKKIVLILSVLGLFFMGTYSYSNENELNRKLLDRLINHFEKLSISRRSEVNELNTLLDDCMKRVKEARMKGEIDRSFFQRYIRVLAAVKLAISDDPEHIFGPVLAEQINRFEGIDENNKVTEKSGIAAISASLALEIASLKVYLLSKKEGLRIKSPMEKEKIALMDDLINKKGTYFQKGKGIPFTGTGLARDYDGNIKDKITFKEGKMNGRRVQYDFGGRAAEGMMKDNTKTGLWIYYDHEGEISKIVHCNPGLRSRFRTYITEMEQGNSDEALKNLKEAIRIKPLEKLKELLKQFPFYQSNYCHKAGKIDCALKYARIWADATVTSQGFDDQSRSRAYYRLGVLYWEKACRRGAKLSKREKEKQITEGIVVLKKSVRYDKLFPDPYTYMALLYRERAEVEPSKKEEYLKMAAAATEVYHSLVKKATAADNKKSYGFPTTSRPGTKDKNTYEIKEDDLLDIVMEEFLFAMPPPPPPPPPLPTRKKFPA